MWYTYSTHPKKRDSTTTCNENHCWKLMCAFIYASKKSGFLMARLIKYKLEPVFERSVIYKESFNIISLSLCLSLCLSLSLSLSSSSTVFYREASVVQCLCHSPLGRRFVPGFSSLTDETIFYHMVRAVGGSLNTKTVKTVIYFYGIG